MQALDNSINMILYDIGVVVVVVVVVGISMDLLPLRNEYKIFQQ